MPRRPRVTPRARKGDRRKVAAKAHPPPYFQFEPAMLGAGRRQGHHGIAADKKDTDKCAMNKSPLQSLQNTLSLLSVLRLYQVNSTSHMAF